MNSVETLRAIAELVESTVGGYVNKGKVRALLDRQAEAVDGHEGHYQLLVGSMLVCGCGERIGVVTVAVTTDPSLIERANAAAWHAYADKVGELAALTGDARQPFVLNVAIAAAVKAALRAYGIEVED